MLSSFTVWTSLAADRRSRCNPDEHSCDQPDGYMTRQDRGERSDGNSNHDAQAQMLRLPFCCGHRLRSLTTSRAVRRAGTPVAPSIRFRCPPLSLRTLEGQGGASSRLAAHYFPFVGFSALSPIWRTLPSISRMSMPESVSNSAGTCAAIFAMSPVILFIPAASPLPVEITVILSTFASGLASALTTSGKPVISLSATAAWLYSW